VVVWPEVGGANARVESEGPGRDLRRERWSTALWREWCLGKSYARSRWWWCDAAEQTRIRMARAECEVEGRAVTTRLPGPLTDGW
jgi:hypothetical protein